MVVMPKTGKRNKAEEIEENSKPAEFLDKLKFVKTIN